VTYNFNINVLQFGFLSVLFQRQTGECDEEVLAICAQLLTANPDITTLWNIRREFLLHFKNEEQRYKFNRIIIISVN
jgi:hypothetical protein